MKLNLCLLSLCLAASPVCVNNCVSQDILTAPSRGGGFDVAPMIHADIFYDYAANQMRVTLDTSQPTPRLVPLGAGYAFDSRSNYAVLNQKAYNFQYAWNPGGVFTNPPGAAVWIECLSASPELEVYDGPGNKMISPPRTYAPIFGTAGSSKRWKWYGAMAHNSYAVFNPTNTTVSATYRIYFGDTLTGAPEAYAGYGCATQALAWKIELPVPPVFQFGAEEQTNGSRLCFLNSSQFLTNSGTLLALRYTNSGPWAAHYAWPLKFMAVAATAANGGPCANHALVGSRLHLQFVSLEGPRGASLSCWEPGAGEPSFGLGTGEGNGTNCLCLSESEGAAGDDPFGFFGGRYLAANQPGLYCLSFRVVDVSTNGTGGTSVHQPSPVYQVYLQGGLTIKSLTKTATSAQVLFGGEPWKTFYLERSASLGQDALWQSVAGPLTGSAKFQTLTNAAPNGGSAFFRLRATSP